MSKYESCKIRYGTKIIHIITEMSKDIENNEPAFSLLPFIGMASSLAGSWNGKWLARCGELVMFNHRHT
jgi:hypothetical protein